MFKPVSTKLVKDYLDQVNLSQLSPASVRRSDCPEQSGLSLSLFLANYILSLSYITHQFNYLLWEVPISNFFSVYPSVDDGEDEGGLAS